MGLAGGIVRKVFSRSPCTSAGGSRGHHSEKGGGSADHHRRRWSSLRLYLCGEEMNTATAAEEDEDDAEEDRETVVSVKSFETCRVTPVDEAHAAVAVPVARRPVSDARDDNRPGEADEDQSRVGVVPAAEHQSHRQGHVDVDVVPATAREEAAAATLIQSAFRGFMARRELRTRQGIDGGAHQEEPRSPTSASVATSVLVQVGESLSNLRLVSEDDSASVQQQQQQQRSSQQNQRSSRPPPPPTPQQPAVFRVKEEWDDSTVSSNVSRMRMQSRIEATTRRERALAYAFSQQLRSCGGGGTSKKRSAAREEEEQQQGELNSVGWSWLERWMATRQQAAADDCVSRNAADTGSATVATTAATGRRVVVVRRRNDVAAAGEEKESCGSNDVVSVLSFDGSSSVSLGGVGARSGGLGGCHNKPAGKSRLKGGRSLPRRKQVAASDHRFQARSHKVSKKGHHQRLEQAPAPHKEQLEAGGGFDDDACHYQPPTDY